MKRTLLAAAALAGTAAAAQVPAPATFDDSLVVTASLEPVAQEDLTATVTVIDSDEIADRQATSVAELLTTVPGIAVVRSGSPGKVTSLFVRGTESDHTLVLWNGIELNNPYFGGFDWAFLPTTGIERVEIVRGPFSAVHGAEAVGGVVQVLSQSGPGGAASVEAGPDGYRRGALAAGVVGRGYELDLGIGVRRGDGLVENDFFASDDLALRAAWRPRDHFSAALVARANESDNGIPFSAGQPSPDREISWRERQVALPVTLVRGSWEVEGRLSRVDYDQRFSDPDDAFGFTASRTESRSNRVRAQAARRFGNGSSLAIGAEREELEVDDRSVFGVGLAAARQATSSVFLAAARDIGPARLDLGVRHDDNDVFGAETTPRAGVVLRLAPTVRLRASWGRGFRAPSLGELFYPLSGNADLAPEESSSWETGIEIDRGRWRLGATAFDTRLQNLIDFDFRTFTNVNVGRARSRGVEAWGRYTDRLLTLQVNAALIDAVDLESRETLLRRPETTSALTATVIPGDWTLTVVGRYVGRRADIDPAAFTRLELGGHVRFDVAGRYRTGGGFEPFARIENLAGRRIEEVAGFPAAGRQWVAGLAARWGEGR